MSFTQEWLQNQDNYKILLVECKVYDTSLGQDVSIFLSNSGYMVADSPFLAIIKGGVSITERLRQSGSLSMSYGDIQLSNSLGELDNYLSNRFIWTNREIDVYFGDPRWNVSTIAELRSGTIFKRVFTGIVADIASTGANTLALKLRSKLEKLNTPLTETKIGTYGVWPGGQQNADQISPIVFGEVHNFTPVFVDPSKLEYRFNTNLSATAEGNTEALIEIRDNGVPITKYTASLTNGTFRLERPAAGAITVSVQGIKASVNLGNGDIVYSYNNSIISTIALIGLSYGSNPVNRLDASELDLVQLSFFEGLTNSFPVGAVISGRDNVLTVMQQLANSVGGQVYMSREGQLQVLRFGESQTYLPTVSITANDIIQGSLALQERIPVVASTKIGYGRNWTVQQGLVTSIPDAQKEAFAIEWLSETVTNEYTKELYKIEAEPVQQDTLLITEAAATAEAERRNAFFSVAQSIFSMVCIAKHLDLKLGQIVELTHPRFGLEETVTCQVVGLVPNWVTQQIAVEVVTLNPALFPPV